MCVSVVLYLFCIFIYLSSIPKERKERREEREKRFKQVKDSSSELIHQEFSLTLVLRDLQSKSFLHHFNFKKCYMVFTHVYIHESFSSPT